MLTQNSLSLPTGFLQIRTPEIPYGEIEWTRDSLLPLTGILALRAGGRTFNIPSTLLPDGVSFVTVRNFINSQSSSQGPKTESSASEAKESRQYSFQCDYEGNGEIYNRNGELLWTFKTEHRRRLSRTFVRIPAYGLFRLADFVVRDKAQKEWLRIRRERRLPMAKFVMLENGSRVCTIKQRSMLLNRYELDFASGSKWNFSMPLFSVFFNAVSDDGARIRVRLWSHNVWYVLMNPGPENPQLVTALAFIHRERLRCI